MVYIHSPVGNNLDTIPGTKGIRRGRIALGLGRKRKYQDVYFCPLCGRDMIYLKEVPCLFCNGCSFTQYMDNLVRRDKPPFEVTDNNISYVANPTNSPRMLYIRNAGNPRSYSTFNKESMLSSSSAASPDIETRDIAERNNMRIVDYVEVTPKDDSSSSNKNAIVTREELRDVCY